MMIRNKILPIAIVAVLLGGTVGAFIAHRSSQPVNTQPAATADNATTPFSNVSNSQTKDQLAAATEKVTDATSYRTGFLDGFVAAGDRNNASRNTVTSNAVIPTTRVVSNTVPVRGRSYSRYDNTRRVYYDYNNQPRTRTFWQKHRDKLTVAMGTGGGALLGGLIGGKKGAAIGALAGGGGSALYTYKIRKRNRRY